MIKKEKLIDMYRVMVQIRTFDERVFKESADGNTPSHAHLYVGEEAVATGACANLRPDDYIISTHRGHGHLIAKGGETGRMFAEIYGKRTGYCKGKGGSMHIAGVDLGVLGANGIVGAGIPIAGGAALSAKLRRTGQVCLCFFGDGAANTSRFHEGINLASILKLPVVYLCENNMYAETVPISYAMNIPNVADRASAYGIPGKIVDGNDVLAIYEVVGEAVARARKGEGPTLVECKTCRWYGHYTGDPQAYRSKEELKENKKKDSILKLKKHLIENSILTEKDIDRIDQEINEEIDQAVKFAEESPFPAPEETLEDVYV